MEGRLLSPPRSRWNLRAARKPIVVAAEFETELFVVDPEIAVTAARHGVRHHPLHLLRDHTDIGLVTAGIAEPVVTETVLEITKQNNVVLQSEVGAPAAASTAAASTVETSAAGRGRARAAMRRCKVRRPARRHVVTASSRPPIHRSGAIPRTGSMRLIAAASTTAVGGMIACPVAATARTVASTRTVAAGVEHLLAALATEVRPVAGASANVVVTEPLLDVRIVITDALAMRRIVVPNVGAVVYEDVAIAPVATAAPIIAPASDRPGGAKGDAGSDDPGADVGPK
jgi:hypothetical protein